jgi:hypothetical protein
MSKCAPLPPQAERNGEHEDVCQGYICEEGICQSCQSDAECQERKGLPTCTQFGDWPGKQCGEVVAGDAGPDANPQPPAEWKEREKYVPKQGDVVGTGVIGIDRHHPVLITDHCPGRSPWPIKPKPSTPPKP